MTIKILNLYAGIGGNRKLWDGDIDVTAIELNPEIAKIYQDFFPQDNIVVCDAHQYLLDHFNEFDFIWSSPPCTSHTSFAKLCALSQDIKTGNHIRKPKYPDLKLYEEIILLSHLFEGKFCVENVVGYYTPLIKPQKLQRHYFWTNFIIPVKKFKCDNIKWGRVSEWEKKLGFSLDDKIINSRKDQILRNCVDPKLGLHVFNYAFKEKQLTLGDL